MTFIAEPKGAISLILVALLCVQFRNHHQTNIMGLCDPVGFESLHDGRASQRKLGGLLFDAAGFGHGNPILRGASTRVLNKYGKDPSE